MSNHRTALVTGVSSGIGQEVAKRLASRGYRVVGTSRNPERVPPSERLAGVEYVALDLADAARIERAAAAAGSVDVLVNNAGESQSGPFEEFPLDALERLFHVNVLGHVRLTQLVLPGMRARGYGRIVMVGSMLASFPLAFRSSYVASKAALRAFATAAREELRPYGVWISTVEPGSIATGISERRTHYLREGSEYTDRYRTVISHLDANERRGIDASPVAETILSAIDAERPRSLYAVGSRAPLMFALRRVLPRATIERLVNRKHGLGRAKAR